MGLAFIIYGKILNILFFIFSGFVFLFTFLNFEVILQKRCMTSTKNFYIPFPQFPQLLIFCYIHICNTLIWSWICTSIYVHACMHVRRHILLNQLRVRLNTWSLITPKYFSVHFLKDKAQPSKSGYERWYNTIIQSRGPISKSPNNIIYSLYKRNQNKPQIFFRLVQYPVQEHILCNFHVFRRLPSFMTWAFLKSIRHLFWSTRQTIWISLVFSHD